MRRFVNSSIRRFVDSARENGMRRFTKTLRAGVLVVAVMAGFLAAEAYEPPEIIGEIEGPEPDTLWFASDFCCIGDQNGDGYDDLLVGHDPYIDGNNHWVNKIYLYNGGAPMNDESDFTWSTGEKFLSLGAFIVYQGVLVPNDPAYIMFHLKLRQVVHDQNPVFDLLFYQAGDSLQSEPIFRLERPDSVSTFPGQGRRQRPTDVNGDGICDLIVPRRMRGAEPYPDYLLTTISFLDIFYGGEDFDTIPDATVRLDSLSGVKGISTGRDVNGDGYDDILVKGWHYRSLQISRAYYYLILGGAPVDSLPAIEIVSDHFENRKMEYGFSLLPDVNDDGYDDWGIYFWSRGGDGFYIFFGSDEPDFEPDLELAGHRRLWADDGDITGGDFNGDGCGDIVGCVSAFNPENSEVFIYFGSRWMDNQADIYIRPERDYGAAYEMMGYEIGAVGDYNGDEIDDFVLRSRPSEIDASKLYIMAGNSGWRVGVDEEERTPVSPVELIIKPNPFNTKVDFVFNLDKKEKTTLRIYDIRGRLVAGLLDRTLSSGSHAVSWSADGFPTGLYLVELVAGNNRQIRKIVLIR